MMAMLRASKLSRKRSFGMISVCAEEDAMKQFINVCTNVKEKHVTSLEQLPFGKKRYADRLVVANLCTSVIPEITADELAIQRCQWPENSATILQALILPNGMNWPTFWNASDVKSLKSEFKHVLFHRVTKHVIAREQHVERSLANDRSVIYFGLSGIGMTVSLNYELLRCLHSWAPRGHPQLRYTHFPFLRVIFRLGNGFYVITNTTKAGDGELSTDVVYVSSHELEDVYDYVEKIDYTSENTLLLLELREDEQHVLRLRYSTIGSASRRAEWIFKCVFKCMGDFYLMDPWSYPECLAMGRVLDASAGNTTQQPITEKIKTVFDYTGGVLRSLLCETSLSRLRADLDYHAGGCLDRCNDMYKFNISSIWAKYGAPFVTGCDYLDHFDGNSGQFRYNYLTNTLRHKVLSKVRSDADVNSLKIPKLWILNIPTLGVLYGGLMAPKNEAFRLDASFSRASYECIVNPADSVASMEVKNKISVKEVFPRLVHKLIHTTSSYFALEDAIDEDAVYESSKLNGPVLDFLVVQNEIAYMIQVSAKAPNENPISVCGMHAVISNLRSRMSDVKEVRFIYVTRKPSKPFAGVQYRVRKLDGSTIESSVSNLLQLKEEIQDEDRTALQEISRTRINIFIATSALFDYKF